MLRMTLIITAAAAALALPAYSQEKPSSGTAVYRLEFNIHDGSDAAAKAGRRYSQTIELNGKGVFRVGNKVPYATGSMQSGQAGGAQPMVTQYAYADVGVNIDSRLRDAGDKILLTADLDLSTLAQHDRSAGAPVLTPTIASLHIVANAALTPGKPTIVASIDDPVTMRKFDVEATVTRIN